MTDTQYLVILGTIYLAPYINAVYCQFIGALMLLAAAAKGLGWL